jgi:hypothetical protein
MSRSQHGRHLTSNSSAELVVSAARCSIPGHFLDLIGYLLYLRHRKNRRLESNRNASCQRTETTPLPESMYDFTYIGYEHSIVSRAFVHENQGSYY